MTGPISAAGRIGIAVTALVMLAAAIMMLLAWRDSRREQWLSWRDRQDPRRPVGDDLGPVLREAFRDWEEQERARERDA